MHDTRHHGATARGLAAAVLAAPAPAAGLAALGTHGAAPACLSPPHEDETRGELGSGGAGFEDHGTADRADCDGVHAGEQQAVDAKRFATLQARLALKGWVLSGGGTKNDDCGHFQASRWGRSVELATMAAAEAFAEVVAP